MNEQNIEYLQLELTPLTQIDNLQKNFDEVKKSCDNVRKGMFKRHSELQKKIEALECQLQNLEALIKKMFLGFAKIAQLEMVESGQMDTLQPVIQTSVTSADALHLFAIPEIGIGNEKTG